MRREPALRVWMSLHVFSSFPGASKWGRNLRRTFDIIGREKKRGGAFTGAQAKSRKSVGMGVYFLTLQWGWDLLWREEPAGQEEPEAGCYLKSLPISLLMPVCVALLSLRNEAAGWKNDSLSSLTVAFHCLNVNTAWDHPSERVACSIRHTRSPQELMGQTRKPTNTGKHMTTTLLSLY